MVQPPNPNGAAALVAITNPPSTACIALVPPSLYAIPGSTGGIVPAGTYPIVAITNLLGNAQGNGLDLITTRGLLTIPYNIAIRGGVTTVGLDTGLAFLNLRNAFTISQVSSCLVN